MWRQKQIFFKNELLNTSNFFHHPMQFFCSSCLSPSSRRENETLICPEGHYFCSEDTCAQAYITQIFSDPHIYYPGKCPICKSLFPQSDLENIMTENQRQVFSEREEKFGTDNKKEGRKSFEERMQELAEEYSSVLKRMEMPEIIEEIIEMESQVFCPQCGLGGKKDLECTHVICQKYQTTYCYVCGKREGNVDKQDEWEGIFSLNENWETNERRCLMHIAEFALIDSRYSCKVKVKLLFFDMRTKVPFGKYTIWLIFEF